MKLYICDSCGHWRATHGFMEFLCRLTNAAYRICCPQCQTAMRQFSRSATIPPFLRVGTDDQEQGFDEEEEEETPEQVEHETQYVTLADIFPEYKAYNEWRQQRRVLHFGHCRGRDA